MVGQEGEGNFELVTRVVFCITAVSMAWEGSKLKIRMTE